jgi:hypothetical protein
MALRRYRTVFSQAADLYPESETSFFHNRNKPFALRSANPGGIHFRPNGSWHYGLIAEITSGFSELNRELRELRERFKNEIPLSYI